MLRANDTNIRSWIDVDAASDFPIQNIPFGIFVPSGKKARVCTRVGDKVIDLSVLADEGLLRSVSDSAVFKQQFLNKLIRTGKETTRALRDEISNLFNIENDTLQNNEELKQRALYNVQDVEMMMPVEVGDYTDFYSSKEHATNVGTMFRDPNNALLPNWLHLPVGYHGRASSIVVSGVPIHRPKGQMKPDDADKPSFGPSKLLDFELEMAFITGRETQLGESVGVNEAEDYIFGMVLFNDWSARDIQKWEYVPLGPFLAKNFGSSVSPWVVTLDALEPFRVEGPKQEPEVLPYLKFDGKKNYNINLEVAIVVDGYEPKTVCKSNFKNMYWNMSQQLAHQTVNGCNIKIGDMYASGTISGPTEDSYGSMLEITWRGTKPIQMPDGSERKFINDGDTVIMRGWGEKNGLRIGFGEVKTKILPAK